MRCTCVFIETHMCRKAREATIVPSIVLLLWQCRAGSNFLLCQMYSSFLRAGDITCLQQHWLSLCTFLLLPTFKFLFGSSKVGTTAQPWPCEHHHLYYHLTLFQDIQANQVWHSLRQLLSARDTKAGTSYRAVELPRMHAKAGASTQQQ